MEKTVKRRALTAEQLEEAAKLKAAWDQFKDKNAWATQTWLASESGIGTQGAVGQYLRGIIPLNVEALAAICKVIQVPPQSISPRLAKLVEAFFTVPSNLDIEESDGPPQVNEEYVECKVASIKKPNESVFSVLDVAAACGNGVVNQDYPQIVSKLVMPSERAFELIGTANRNGQIKVINAVKDSMIPTINPNDLLFVDVSVKEYVGEAVYILYHGNELVCKRLSLVGKNLIVSSDNEFYQAWNWADRPEATKIVGKVLRALPMNFKVFGT